MVKASPAAVIIVAVISIAVIPGVVVFSRIAAVVSLGIVAIVPSPAVFRPGQTQAHSVVLQFVDHDLQHIAHREHFFHSL